MTAEPIPLPGMPTTEPEPPTARHLVAAWCSGWSAAHDGAQPDPSVVRRVAGICRTVARDRTDLDSWRAAWRACLDAGRRGRFDVVSVLAEPTPVVRGRQNHYLSIARAASESPLGQSLAAHEIGTSR